MKARFRACWVTHADSGRLVVPATWTRLVESSMKNRDVQRPQEYRLDCEEVAGQHSPALGSEELAQVGPVRRGAGPRPERRRIRRIVVAPTRIPSLRSSPWIRTQPHRGFSRPRRVMSSTVSGSRGGRPGRRLR